MSERNFIFELSANSLKYGITEPLDAITLPYLTILNLVPLKSEY